MITVIECVGGWLIVYAPNGGWTSAVYPALGCSASHWMVPGGNWN